MKKATWRKSALAFLMAGVLIFTSAGCTGVPKNFLEEIGWKLLETWLDYHEVNPKTPGGAVALARRAASGSTSDEDADAVMGAIKQFNSINEGDKLMAEGQQLRAQGKLTEAADAMDDAIAERPQDWTYRVSRASLAFQNGDTKIADRELNLADKTVQSGGSEKEEVRYHTQIIDELETSEFDVARMAQDTKVVYFRQLKYAYQNRGFLTENEADRATGLHYQDLLEEIGREAEAKKK